MKMASKSWSNPDLGSPKSTFESASPQKKLPAVSPGSAGVRGCGDDDSQVQQRLETESTEVYE